MKVHGYDFEGTPEEFLKVSDALRGAHCQAHSDNSRPLHSNSEAYEASTAPDKRFVIKDQAVRILTRRKLSQCMDKFIRELYHAGDKKVKSDHLRKLLGFDDAADKKGADRFRGLLGAFGRRVAHDVPGDVSFFDDEWNADEGQKEWRLPPSVRQAIDELRWYR